MSVTPFKNAMLSSGINPTGPPSLLLENLDHYQSLSKKTERVSVRARGMYYDFGKGRPAKPKMLSRMINADIL